MVHNKINELYLVLAPKKVRLKIILSSKNTLIQSDIT